MVFFLGHPQCTRRHIYIMTTKSCKVTGFPSSGCKRSSGIDFVPKRDTTYPHDGNQQSILLVDASAKGHFVRHFLLALLTSSLVVNHGVRLLWYE